MFMQHKFSASLFLYIFFNTIACLQIYFQAVTSLRVPQYSPQILQNHNAIPASKGVKNQNSQPDVGSYAIQKEQSYKNRRLLNANDTSQYNNTNNTNNSNSSASCANGIVTLPEQCDDGNSISGDGCSSNCTIQYCGDSIVNNYGSQQCDDGNNRDGDGCSSVCQIECGDGSLQSNQECDDGNFVSGDGCSNLCARQVSANALSLQIGLPVGIIAFMGVLVAITCIKKSNKNPIPSKTNNGGKYQIPAFSKNQINQSYQEKRNQPQKQVQSYNYI